MKITRAKLNGIVNPLGFDLKKLIASWNVEETESKSLKTGFIEVSDDISFSNIWPAVFHRA